MWILYQNATTRGDSAGQESARAGLVARFPDSPETALASAGSTPEKQAFITAAASPWPDLLSPYDVQPAPSVIKAPPEPTQAPSLARYSVQAGAFQMKENADDLVGELTRSGFMPVVVRETIQGKDRFRVLAAAGLSIDDARGVVQTLEKLGYSGFLSAEK
jgi:cell division protein FtsN